MGSTKKLTSMVAVLAASIALPGVANAADLLEPPVVEVPEVVTQAKGGWYIRGDISLRFPKRSTIPTPSPTFPRASVPPRSMRPST